MRGRMFGWRVPSFTEDIWIAPRHRVPRGDRVSAIAPEQARWQLHQWLGTMSDRGALVAMCEALGEPMADGARVSADELLSRVRAAIRRGDLVAYRITPGLLGSSRSELQVQEKRVEPREALTWVEVVFVWAEDGSPVPGLKVEITPPGQAPIAKQADGSGKVRLDSIQAGSCRVASSFEDVKAAECVTFVDMGEPPEPPTQRIKPQKRKKDERPAPKAVALLRPYRVRAADTLASLAQAVGLTAQQLARFNWGVDDPAGVNQHLRDDVGCWQKDGGDYVFSDFDDPGVIVLPRPWSASGLSTADTHYVQVRRLPPAPRFIPWSQ